MPRKQFIQAHALNIAANPHPDGVYLTLLQVASGFLVRSRGSDFAKITSPHDAGDDMYTGRILVWTEIDVQGAWLDLSNEDQLPESVKRGIAIPENAKPNYRTFDYVFDNRGHRMYFESRTERRSTLGAITAKRIFSSLLSPDIQGPDSPDVEVTLVPDEKAVDVVLGLPGLRNLYIRIVLPNPDTPSSDAKRRVYEQMRKANARLAEEHYAKSRQSDRLEPTPDMRERAEVAAENGFVRGEGRAADGRGTEAATDSSPKRYNIGVDEGGTFLERVLRSLGLRGR